MDQGLTEQQRLQNEAALFGNQAYTGKPDLPLGEPGERFNAEGILGTLLNPADWVSGGIGGGLMAYRTGKPILRAAINEAMYNAPDIARAAGSGIGRLSDLLRIPVYEGHKQDLYDKTLTPLLRRLEEYGAAGMDVMSPEVQAIKRASEMITNEFNRMPNKLSNFLGDIVTNVGKPTGQYDAISRIPHLDDIYAKYLEGVTEPRKLLHYGKSLTHEDMHALQNYISNKLGLSDMGLYPWVFRHPKLEALTEATAKVLNPAYQSAADSMRESLKWALGVGGKTLEDVKAPYRPGGLNRRYVEGVQDFIAKLQGNNNFERLRKLTKLIEEMSKEAAQPYLKKKVGK